MIKVYLTSNILWLIQDFNNRFKFVNDKRLLRKIANEEFNESDLVNRLVTPMLNLATINSNSRDIVIRSLNFEVEVKFLRNFKSEKGYASKTMWECLSKDFFWLGNSIKRNKKGKRAFLVGWFNIYDYLGEIIQLGNHVGRSPKINPARVKYFPFIQDGIKYTKESRCDYTKSFTELQVFPYEKMQCVFFGNEADIFHMALYY